MINNPTEEITKETMRKFPRNKGFIFSFEINLLRMINSRIYDTPNIERQFSMGLIYCMSFEKGLSLFQTYSQGYLDAKRLGK